MAEGASGDAGTGTALTLIATPEAEHDPALSHLAREAVTTTVTGRAPARESGLVSAAVGLSALLDRATALTAGERVLLAERLDRIARHDG